MEALFLDIYIFLSSSGASHKKEDCSGVKGAEKESPLSWLWRQDRKRERRQSRSRERTKRSRGHSGEKKEERRQERR